MPVVENIASNVGEGKISGVVGKVEDAAETMKDKVTGLFTGESEANDRSSRHERSDCGMSGCLG